VVVREERSKSGNKEAAAIINPDKALESQSVALPPPEKNV